MKQTRILNAIKSFFEDSSNDTENVHEPEYKESVDYTVFGENGEHTVLTDDDIREFVTGKFLRCIYPVCHWQKVGETYWFEYSGNCTYNVRSDNALGKQFSMTVHQLVTGFVPVDVESDPYMMLMYFYFLGQARMNDIYIRKILDYYKSVGLFDGKEIDLNSCCLMMIK